MKTLFLSAAAAVAVAAISPALAHTAPADPHAMAMQPVTRVELVQKVQAHFAKLDANRDGFVTKDEMNSAREHMRSEVRTRVEQRLAEGGGEMPDRGAVFDRLDTNHDGSISRQEFTSAQPQVKERRVIVMRDDGGQGSAGEHEMMRMHMHRMGMGLGGHMFEMADADKDGRVSLQEATNAAAAHFDKADTNHDGTLTPDEMRSAHQGMERH